MPDDIIERLTDAAALYEQAVLGRHKQLRVAHDESEKMLDRVREDLAANPPPAALGIGVLAVAGSLARREASSLSDIDLIITIEQEDHDATDAIIQWREALCARLEIERPNPNGVFHEPISRSRVQRIAGASDEPYHDTSKRILFLLESAPVANAGDYENLLDSIIDRYATDVAEDPTKNFVFLLNDVIRYFRLVCVNYQNQKTEETANGKWPLRNVKLRHSRVLMYFSMVAAIGLLSRERGADKAAALKLLVRMHPLKRLFVAYQLADDPCFYRVAGLYDTFITLLSKEKTRNALRAVDYETRYDSSVFSQLKANSDAFAAELMRFYDARRGYWDERFFEYMIL